MMDCSERIERLTHEPPQGNYEACHNTAIIKDRHVFLRSHGDDGDDICVVKYFVTNICRKECGDDVWGGEIPTPEDFDALDCCLSGCPYAPFYHIAIGAAEMRSKLFDYEETGLSPEHAAELAEAEKDGRLVVLPCKQEENSFSNKYLKI